MDVVFARQLADAVESGRRFALVTVVETTGSSPQKAGARMLVFEDGSIAGTVGGGKIEHLFMQDARQAVSDGEPRLVTYNLTEIGMACGGHMKAFVEPLGTGSRVTVFGCGHVCRALAPLLLQVGFSVNVVDDRPEWADPAAFPAGVRVRCCQFQQAMEDMAHVGQRDYVLAMTRGHDFDYEVLRFFVEKGAAYLGGMASRKKTREFKDRMLEEGVPQDAIDRMHVPVGLPIGSVTPQEIAVSVAAQMILVRKG